MDSLTRNGKVERKTRRWRWLLRVSLRTLLILMTLAAVWLGVVFKRVRDQRAAVARIQALSGTLRYDYEGAHALPGAIPKTPPGAPGLRRLLGPELFQDVVAVRLGKSAVTDEDLRLIGKLRRLTHLHLDATSIGDAGLRELRYCRRLKSLVLMETRVTGDGLAYVAEMRNLEELNLWKTSADDAGVRHLRGMTELTSLYLGQSKVTSQSIIALKHCNKLVQLDINETAVDDDAVPTLIAFPKLGLLWASGTKVSGPGLARIREALPDLDIQGDIADCRGAVRKGKQQIRGYKNWTPITDRLTSLSNERRLKLVDFRWTNFADADLPRLFGLSAVEYIDVRHSQVTAVGAKSLREALPQCEIRH